ncbi:hypothetical protein [Bradyrhizobium sp. USDA 377]
MAVRKFVARMERPGYRPSGEVRSTEAPVNAAQNPLVSIARKHAADKNLIFQRLLESGADVEDAYQKYWKEFETGFWEVEISVGRFRYPPDRQVELNGIQRSLVRNEQQAGRS